MADSARITAFYKLKPGASAKEFNMFWFNEFPKVFKSLKVVQGKDVKYELGIPNAHVNEVLETAGFWTVASYDAQTTIEGSSFAELMRIFMSEEYRTTIGTYASKYIEPAGLIYATDTTVLSDIHA